MDFEEYLGKSEVSENRKVYHGWFLRNRLLERHCYIGKSRWDLQYLEIFRISRNLWKIPEHIVTDVSIFMFFI